MPKQKGLLERINDGETIICAEGYLFAFERRGYLKAGPFTPEVVMDHPEMVRQMYADFVHAGSDVVQAFTYYGNRHKFNIVGRRDQVEKQNRLALQMAREVADRTGTLMCGDLSNTMVYKPDDDNAIEDTKHMFQEQIEWAAEEGADFIVGETFDHVSEAVLATQMIKTHGKSLPAVVTLASHLTKTSDGKPCTVDGVEFIDALRQLEAAGTDVVGFNCTRGPGPIMTLVESAIQAGIKTPLAALPVTYRTTEDHPSFLAIPDPARGIRAFPVDLDCLLCSRSDIAEFGQRCAQLKIPYVGLCCGNAPHYTRTLAESLGRTTPASKFSPDMSLHGFYGTDKEKLSTYYSENTNLYSKKEN